MLDNCHCLCYNVYMIKINDNETTGTSLDLTACVTDTTGAMLDLTACLSTYRKVLLWVL